MASSASTSTASIEPAAHTNSTAGSKATSSAAALQTPIAERVLTVKTDFGLKATRGGYGFTRSTDGGPVTHWECDLRNCGATMKTKCMGGEHYFIFDPKSKPHNKEVHMRDSSRPPGGRKRKADSCAHKPTATVNGDARVPAKKSTGHRLPVGGAFIFKPNARPHSQGTPPGNAEDAARDKRKIESAKGSGAGNLVDSGAAADRRSPVHFQHPGGSNEPGTSAWPSGHQGAQESEIVPPPTPPPRADHADTVQIDSDDGDDSDCILIDDPSDGDIEENPGTVKREAGDVNYWDAKAGGSSKKVYQQLELLHEEVGGLRRELDEKVYRELELLREEVGGLRQEIDGLKEVHDPAPAASPPPPVLPKLPMETAEDFQALETFLADKNNFELMVERLMSFDGSTLGEKANGMMTSLFSLELAATYNYTKGSKGKLVFKGTLPEKAVLRAAEKSFPGLEHKEYTSHLRKRFCYAYTKLKRQEDARILKILRACGGARPEVVPDQA
ncbi:unnamed protein product [Ixodes pacificus]